MKVFKNPNRGKNKHIAQEPYTPEHVRLNKEPIVTPVSREEFRRQPPRAIKVPEQVRVNSGQNMEGGWSQVPVSNQQRAPQLPPVRPEVQIKERSYVNSFYDEPVASSAVPDFSTKLVEDIDDDEVDLPNDDLPELDNNSVDFTSIQVGEFILMYDNDIIASGSLEEITEVVENILTSDEYNVSVEKIVVLKKMNLRTGVLISE